MIDKISQKQLNPSFGQRIKVIKYGKDKCHTGLIKVLGLEDDFKKGIKELSKETRKKKLDVFIGGSNKGYNSDGELKILVGKDKKLYETVTLIDSTSKTSAKEMLNYAFDSIKNYISRQ